MHNIILVQDFCPLKLKLLDFLPDFVLILWPVGQYFNCPKLRDTAPFKNVREKTPWKSK